MKLKMLTSMAGIDFALSSGDMTDRFSDAEAQRLIEAGYAVPVREAAVERAVKAAPEFAAFDHDGDGRPGGSKPKPRGKGKG